MKHEDLIDLKEGMYIHDADCTVVKVRRITGGKLELIWSTDGGVVNYDVEQARHFLLKGIWRIVPRLKGMLEVGE